MRILARKTLAVSLVACVTLQLAQAMPTPFATDERTFSIALPHTLGFVSDSFSAHGRADKPDIILIQNVHVNRSVQFAISGILRHLRRQSLLP